MGRQNQEKPDTNSRIAVLVPLPFAEPLDYLVPDGLMTGGVMSGEMTLSIGAYVEVPVGARRLIGVIWSLHRSDSDLHPDKLKPITRMLDVPSMGADLARLVDFIADYTLSPRGSVLKMCLGLFGGKKGVDLFDHRPTATHVFVPPKLPDGPVSEKRQAVINALTDKPPMLVSVAARKAGASPAVVRAMVQKGLLHAVDLPTDQLGDPPRPDAGHSPVLSDEQQTAASAIGCAIKQQQYQSFLLDGVTGSGKTEVYFEAIANLIAADPAAQILVLLPEIALTAQWLERFQARFGVKPALWHSDVGQAEKRRVWHGAASGTVNVIVGARSSLFLPFKNLSLIIVDEEHDPSFKQEDGVLYHARDMAVARAFHRGCPVVLASATPSLESLANVDAGRYKHLILRQRHGGAALPHIQAIDMRTNAPVSSHWLSPVLVEKITETILARQQTALFLNRRGYAPLTLCRSCGHRVECPNCTAWLVDHRSRGRLQCHHCGFDMPSLYDCPQCGAEDSLVACGPGVERLQEEVVTLFPDAKVAAITSDTMTSPQKMALLVNQIEAGAIDIIIGTQMITKGYHFPNLTLVGVVDADLGLRGGDLRAGERTYQQLVQVAGRAGRASKPGQVFLQTFEPEHPVVQALLSGDGHTYIQAEMDMRRTYAMPPYGKLVALILSGEDNKTVITAGRKLAALAPVDDTVRVMGPAPAPMGRLRGLYRHRLLVHAQKSIKVQAFMRQWLAATGPIKGVKIKVDIDPYSFM